MTGISLERVRKAIKHMEPDRVPVGPYMGNYGAVAAGVRLMDYYTSGRVMADAQFAAWELFGQDIVVPQSDGYYMAEGFGTKTQFRENATPVITEHALQSLDQTGRLKVPDPLRDGRMPVYLEAITLLAERLGGHVCVRATGTGAFSLASHLIGINKFLNAIMEAEYDEDREAEKRVFELMELATEATVRFARAALDAGANLVQCGDSLASLNIISPAIYEKYAFPFERKFFNSLRPFLEKRDAAAILHICGNNTKILDLMVETGADILELDYKVDLGYCKKAIGDRVCLMGNLNPAGVLLTGSPEEVEAEARECIVKAGSGGGFILGSGCEVAAATPIQNMHALVNSARRFGTYF